MSTPTLEGRHRYRDTGGYYRRRSDDGDRYPCRCESWCGFPCDGECGCGACKTATVDRGAVQSGPVAAWYRWEP